MQKVDEFRATRVYEHKDCSDECRKRGCGKLFSIDGNWKLTYPICTYKEPKSVSGFNGSLKYVDTCPNQPANGLDICLKHCKYVNKEDSLTSSEPECDKVDSNHITAADCQGTTTTLKRLSSVVDIDAGENVTTMTCCNKETGANKKFQKRTRGIWLCGTGGGHIQMWQPLYQSEGPSQVFLLTLTWLLAAFGKEKRERWQDIILSYDNMCHLDNLKVSKENLPLPGDLRYIWKDIKKIIDSLHIRNHVDPVCKEKYDPSFLKEENPCYNTMVCEQTFAWLSRYKRILGSMPKVHFHFFMHRMVKHRNSYISHCYNTGRRPIHHSKLHYNNC